MAAKEVLKTRAWRAAAAFKGWEAVRARNIVYKDVNKKKCWGRGTPRFGALWTGVVLQLNSECPFLLHFPFQAVSVIRVDPYVHVPVEIKK